MPYVYANTPAANLATSGSANTEVDSMYIKPGTGRSIALFSVLLGGKGAGLTALSGIVARIRGWSTTATALNAGTAITPQPKDITAQAAKHTCGANVGGALTPGTGASGTHLSVVSGAAGPGAWVARDNDSMINLESGANKSIDLFSASGTASLNYEPTLEVVEF